MIIFFHFKMNQDNLAEKTKNDFQVEKRNFDKNGNL